MLFDLQEDVQVRRDSAKTTKSDEKFVANNMKTSRVYQVNLQKSENARLQQQLTTLKGEKTSIQVHGLEQSVSLVLCQLDT